MLFLGPLALALPGQVLHVDYVARGRGSSFKKASWQGICSMLAVVFTVLLATTIYTLISLPCR